MVMEEMGFRSFWNEQGYIVEEWKRRIQDVNLVWASPMAIWFSKYASFSSMNEAITSMCFQKLNPVLYTRSSIEY